MKKKKTAARKDSIEPEEVEIAEKIRFWQEQDRINQELIPRFIKQSRLLDAHLKQHEDLVAITVQAVHRALAETESHNSRMLEETVERLTHRPRRFMRWMTAGVIASLVLALAALAVAILA